MKKYKLTFAATIILSRLTVLIIESQTDEIFNDDFHHYYVGIILLIITLYIKNIYIFSIANALIIDEIMLPIHLLGFWDKGYWDLAALIPVMLSIYIYYVYFDSMVNLLKLNTHD